MSTALAGPFPSPAKTTDIRESVTAEMFAARTHMVERLARRIEAVPERPTPEEVVRMALIADASEHYHNDGALLQRFYLGVVARAASAASKPGDRVMESLGDATGIHPNTIRQCKRLAETMDNNLTKFDTWLRSIFHRTRKPARWYHVEELIGTFSDATVLGAEELADRIIRDAERTVKKLDLIAGSESAEGVKVALSESARRVREVGMQRLENAEQEAIEGIPRNPLYLRFVSKLPCIATGETPPDDGWEPYQVGMDPHHVGTGGTAIKASDYTCVPLCREAHTYLHDNGVRAFQEAYSVNLPVELFQTLHLFVTEQKADLPPMGF